MKWRHLKPFLAEFSIDVESINGEDDEEVNIEKHSEQFRKIYQVIWMLLCLFTAILTNIK